MRVIHKTQTLAEGLPQDAVALHVAVQNNKWVIWYMTDPNKSAEPSRRVLIGATGETVPDGFEYVATLLDDGLVWHFFVEQQVTP